MVLTLPPGCREVLQDGIIHRLESCPKFHPVARSLAAHNVLDPCPPTYQPQRRCTCTARPAGMLPPRAVTGRQYAEEVFAEVQQLYAAETTPQAVARVGAAFLSDGETFALALQFVTHLLARNPTLRAQFLDGLTFELRAATTPGQPPPVTPCR